MSDVLQVFLKQLPSHFEKKPDSNNYKLLSMAAKQAVDRQEVLRTIQRFRDVDQAEGAALDRLGKDEGISRGSYDDETYRKMIKIQYFVNLSEADIESMNTILRAYMEDNFLFFEEGWESIFNEPASMVLYVGPKAKSIPYSVVKKIKPAGVRVYYAVKGDTGVISLESRARSFGVPYPITNRFSTARMDGKLAKASLSLSGRSRNFVAPFPITNVMHAGNQYVRNIKAETIGLHARTEILYATYPRCGEVIL